MPQEQHLAFIYTNSNGVQDNISIRSDATLKERLKALSLFLVRDKPGVIPKLSYAIRAALFRGLIMYENEMVQVAKQEAAQQAATKNNKKKK